MISIYIILMKNAEIDDEKRSERKKAEWGKESSTDFRECPVLRLFFFYDAGVLTIKTIT